MPGNPRRVRKSQWRPFCFAALLLWPLWSGCAVTRPADRLKPLTFEAIYGPGPVDFTGAQPEAMDWIPAGGYFVQRRDGLLQKVDAVSGEATPAYDHAALEAALEAHQDFDRSAAWRLARHPTLLSADYALALLSHENRLYLYRFQDGTLTRLTEQAVDRELISFSPDGSRIAFVHDNDLYTIDLVSGRQTRLTHDGSDTVLNGKLDWVYQEEVYGRGQWRAYWWSPDGQALAYLRLDETEVPLHTIVDQVPTHPSLEQFRFPKAGDPNPVPRLGVVRPADGQTVWVDLSSYGEQELLIVAVGWSPDGQVVYCVQDREQRWLDLNQADPQSGVARTLLSETSPAWVENFGLPRWLEDGSFLWRSARDGWPHLYHYSRDGKLLCRLTSGPWEVRELHGVDEESGWVYFSGTCDSPVELHAYRTSLQGASVQRLTEPGFSHRASFDPHCRYFFDTFSSLTTPPRVYLRRSDGELVRIISDPPVTSLLEYRLSQPEILRITADNGRQLNAMIIRPPHRQPGRKYPVVHFVYGGPHAPTVQNAWHGREYMFQQLLAQKGYIVWMLDPYSASGEGLVSAWSCYQRLGAAELEDLEAGLRWLARHENADLQRVAILGHSYGGYVVAYALTHSRMFKVGIAAAAVTDWRNYDTIYTERYMRRPENNPEGYDQASALVAAGKLHGRLLLVHGMRDDNVHVQSAFQLADRLQQLGKQFDLMLYPADGHGLHHARDHWLRLRLAYIEQNL